MDIKAGGRWWIWVMGGEIGGETEGETEGETGETEGEKERETKGDKTLENN